MNKRCFNAVSFLSICLVTLMTGGCQERNTVHVIPVGSELLLLPKTFRISNALPGQYAGTFKLTNNFDHEISNLRVLTSCYCVTPGQRDIKTIKPHQTINIPFKIEFTGAMHDIQQIVVTSHDYKTIYVRAGIDGDVVLPFNRMTSTDIPLTTLHRTAATNGSEEQSDSFSIYPGIVALRVVPASPWMSVKTKVNKDHVVVTAASKPMAPEGRFEVPAQLFYRTSSRSGNMNVIMVGRITSTTHVHPTELVFGILKKHTPSSKLQCTVGTVTRHSLPVVIQCFDRRVHTKLRAVNEHSIIYDVWIVSGSSGNIQTHVSVLNGPKVLATTPVEAFVL